MNETKGSCGASSGVGVEFTKMHALGNDYVLFDGFRFPNVLRQAHVLAPRLSDRRFGIGGDGLIFAVSSATCDIGMRMFNADGSEAEMCGNGIRQLAKFAYLKKLVGRLDMNIETRAGEKGVVLNLNAAGEVSSIEVDLGEPVVEPARVPVHAPLDTRWGLPVCKVQVDERSWEFSVVSMGNPHAVCFVPDVTVVDLERVGRAVECMVDLFPQRVNVEFAQVVARDRLAVRVWERGSGATLACGTGAAATTVVAVSRGLVDSAVMVKLPGGNLHIEWNRVTNHVFMIGDATVVFEGRLSIP